MHIKHGRIWSYHGAHAPCWDIWTLVTNISSPTVTLNLCLVEWKYCVQWRRKSINVFKRPFMGEFLLIHWWPHNGSVMRKVFPCHYFDHQSDPLPAYVTDNEIGCNSLPDDFFLRKKIILFHSYLEMRQDGDTPDHTDSALLQILVSGSEFIHLWTRRPDANWRLKSLGLYGGWKVQ